MTGLSGVRARLTPSAGFLLPTECTADFGAGRVDIDVGDAAVRAISGEEALGLLQILSEDER